MANPEHLAILKPGVEAWNKWRTQTTNFSPDLRGIVLSDAEFSDINFEATNLSGATLRSTKLRRADLRGSTLIGTDFALSDLRNAKLYRAIMDNANLAAALLDEARLDQTQCTRADFTGARLYDASLSEAQLYDANLVGAYLQGANLRWAHFDRADLRGASLQGTYFEGSKLSECDMSGATFLHTVFVDTDLSTVKGLDSVVHSGPSTIGIDTLYKSGGNIPDEFLRGAGVPEEIIDIAHSIRTGPAIQWHSCFISYSTQDEEFARRLHARMREAGLRVWFAPEDMKGGDKLYDQVDRAIHLYDKLLLVLSESSIQSEWVMTEIRKAREVEKKENRRKLFPIRLVDFDTLRNWTCFDADTGKDLAVELREYFIPDFSDWKKHDAFEAAFARLLKDLRAEDSKKT